MNIGEFFVKLGVNADFVTVDKFGKAIQGEAKRLTTLAVVATGAAVAFDRLYNSTVQNTVALQNFRNQTGLSINQLQRWQVASQLSDITLTAEQTAQSIAGLQKNLTDIKLGAGDVSGFQLLGIQVAGKNAFQVLEDVREAIKGLDDATATNLIQRIGLSPQFINVLRQSREEFEKLGKGRFLSEKQRKQVLALGTAFTKFKIESKLLKDELLAGLTPQIMELFKGFQQLLRFGKDLILDISKMDEAMTGLKIAAAALAIAFAPVTSAVLGLFLLLEDFVAYTEGRKSVLGDFLKAFGTVDEGGIFTPKDAPLPKGSPFKQAEEERKQRQKAADAGTFDFLKSLGKDIVGGAKEVFSLGDKLQIIDPAKKQPAPAQGQGPQSNATFNNTFNIQSQGSPEEIANEIAAVQKREFRTAFADVQSGVIL